MRPQTPLQKVLSRVPSVSFVIHDEDTTLPPSPAMPSPSPTSPSPRRRLSIVIERKRDFHPVRTTISMDLMLAQAFLIVLLFMVVPVSGLVLGGGASSAIVPGFGRRSAVATAAPVGWATPQATTALERLADSGAPLRARVGLVQFCMDAEHHAELHRVDKSAFSPRNWLLSQATDLACSIAFPSAFGDVRRWRELRAPTARRALAGARETVEAALESALPSDTKFSLQTRYKSSTSLFEKLVLRGHANANDVLGLRVVLEDDGAKAEAMCHEAAAIVTSLWPLRAPPKDYISRPKANGYQSIHLTVELPSAMKMEVQIRTSGMHEVAECGAAAHGQYKLDCQYQM